MCAKGRRLYGLLILLIVGLLASPASAQQLHRMTVYYSPTCESCQMVEEQLLPTIAAAYEGRLQIEHIDVSRPEGLAELEALEQERGLLNNPFPVILLGDALIADEDFFALEDELWNALREQVGEPSNTGSGEAVTSPVPSAAEAPASEASSAGPAIHLAYVEKAGCSSCARAAVVLDALQAEFPTLIVSRFDNVEDAAQVEAMGDALQLAPERRLIGPSIYVGSEALIDDEISSEAVRSVLERYRSQGAPAFWEALDVAQGQSSILMRFRSMGPLAVAVAGLIDGINPCAFATILFFVSYLAVSRRPRRQLMAVGLAFTFGVFATYMLVGLGAMSLLRWASAFSVVGKVLYALFGITCLALAGVSLYDYALARQGRLKEMRLNLPDSLRERIKGRIRMASGAYAGAALLTGVVVSLMELACTGQVYLPTISFMVGVPEMRAAATGYLLLYNVLFVTPLLIVLVMAVYGVRATRFSDWFTRHAATTKLVMAAIFVLLGILLIAQAFA